MRSYLAKSFYQNYEAKVKKNTSPAKRSYTKRSLKQHMKTWMDQKKDREEVKTEPARVNFERPSFMACDLLLTYMV
jgi:hypothetical protein